MQNKKLQERKKIRRIFSALKRMEKKALILDKLENDNGNLMRNIAARYVLSSDNRRFEMAKGLGELSQDHRQPVIDAVIKIDEKIGAGLKENLAKLGLDRRPLVSSQRHTP